MNRQKKVILGVILAAVILMGIGYAAFDPKDVSIGGTATASANQENFQVCFTGETDVSEVEGIDVAVGGATAEAPLIDGATHATLTITGLTKNGDSAYAILAIKNESADINATSVKVTAETITDDADTADYFTIDAEMYDDLACETLASVENPVACGGTTYVRVQVNLTKTPTGDAPIVGTINVVVTATPAEQ